MNLRKRQRGVSAEVHTSAMNDIMFFLLLFFLIAATLTSPSVIKLLLPKSSSGKPILKKTIRISVTKDLRYYIDQKEVKIGDLPNVLAGYKKQATELTVVLYVDKTVTIQNVVQIMDISQKLDIKLVLATEPK
jgi:biopolymer transport protein ExbD